MKQSILDYAVNLLAEQKLPVYQKRKTVVKAEQLLKGPHGRMIQEVYQDLGGLSSCRSISAELPDGLETNLVRLTIDGALHFNRYRATTLQSPLYRKYEPVWLPAYRRNCRSAERECLKDGSRKGVWTNAEAEKHFGEASEPGDFFGTGSPGWKLLAFQNFLADVFLFQSAQKHSRISIFDRLMVQGRLMPLGELLSSRSEQTATYLCRYLARQLEVASPEPGKSQDIS